MTDGRRQRLLARMTEAWRMRARGWTQLRIARELGVSQGTVSRLLKLAERVELRKFSGEYERTKVTQHAQLEHAAEEAFDAWHRSKTPRKRAASKTTPGEGDAPDEVRTTEVIERDGDTSYLYAALHALAEIRKLWGLDVAPASNDAITSLSQMSAGLFARAQSHEQEQAADGAPGDPVGADGAPGGGADPVPDGPGPVQPDHPL